MDMHPKKRIEIVVEAPILNRLLDLLNDARVSGYTVLPALAGRGHHGRWSGDNLATDVGRMTMVMIIVDENAVAPLLDSLYGIISRHIGIITVSDVQVIRREKF